MGEFDPGPPPALAAILDRMPDFAGHRQHFWFDWGPVFYRGRLDGSARVLCVASDPGPTERIAGRTLVGDAGQRVQGFLARIGLTRSYVCVNALPYALFPSHGGSAAGILADPDILAWRNELYDAARGPSLQAIVAFGVNAQRAVDHWPGRAGVPVLGIPHPSSRNPTQLLDRWRAAVGQLRGHRDPGSRRRSERPQLRPDLRRRRLRADPPPRPPLRRPRVARRRRVGPECDAPPQQLRRAAEPRRPPHADLDRAGDVTAATRPPETRPPET